MWTTEPGGMSGPDRRQGGPVRSIRKNHVLPGSGPSDLHYGKNGYVLSGVERTGPPDGGPARVVRRGRAGAGGERGADRLTRRIDDPAASKPAGVSHGGF